MGMSSVSVDIAPTRLRQVMATVAPEIHVCQTFDLSPQEEGDDICSTAANFPHKEPWFIKPVGVYMFIDFGVGPTHIAQNKLVPNILGRCQSSHLVEHKKIKHIVWKVIDRKSVV